MKRKNKEIISKIEQQEVLAETPRRGYELIRLSRVKYKKNPYSFIDLRLFQTDHGDSDNGTEQKYHPTKKGIQVKEGDFQNLIGKWTLVPSLLFHKIILKKAWPCIERKEYEDAVFKSFKLVEIEVRKVSKLPQELVGTKLMRQSFDPEKGTLTDYTVPKAERIAIADLFSGSIGLYKNPCSHREVDIEFNEAFEILLVASHLLNIIDKIRDKFKS